MRRTLFALALALTPALLPATVLEASGYTARSESDPGGLTFSWVDVSGTGTNLVSLGSDDAVFNATLGAGFTFYGVTYTSANASTNGNLQFGSTDTAWTALPLSVGNMGATIFVFWNDLHVDPATWLDQGIFYQYFASGVHPGLSGPTSVFQWHASYCCDGSPTNVRFEILLEHTTGRVLLQYNNPDGSTRGTGGQATIGIQDGKGGFLEWTQPDPVPSGLAADAVFPGSTVLFEASAVPEPGTYALVGLGLAMVGTLRRRQ